MAIPKLQEVVRAMFATDGGSITLYILDDSGSHHRLELVQHLIPTNSSIDRKFGRLYLDDCLIDVRSPDETAIMNSLRKATVRPGCQQLVEEVFAFVQSDEYVRLARG